MNINFLRDLMPIWQETEEPFRQWAGRWLRRLVMIGGVLSFLVGAGFFLHRFYDFRTKQHARSFLEMAQRAAREGKQRDEIRSLVSCLSLAPEFLGPYWRLAEILRQGGSNEEADAWIDRMVAANEDKVEAHVMRGQYLLATDRVDAAEEAAEAALNLNDGDRGALMLSVQCAAKTGPIEKVRKRAERLVDYHPWHVAVYPLMGEQEVKAGHPEKAIDWFAKGLEQSPKDEGMLWALSNLLIEQRRLAEAEPYILRFRDARPNDILSAFVLARLRYIQGQWVAAADLFAQIRPALATRPDLRRQGDLAATDCYARLGDGDKQLELARKAASDDPNDLACQGALVNALLADGQIDEAIEEYRKLTERPDLPDDARLQLVRLCLFRQMSRSDDADGWKAVEKEWEAAAHKLHGEHALLPVLKAEIFLAEKMSDEAEQVLREAVAKNPRQSQARFAMVALACRQRKWKEAHQLLDQCQRDFGDSIGLRLARATTLASELGPSALKQIRALADKPESLKTTELASLWRGLAQLGYQLNDYPFSLAMCQKLLQGAPRTSENWLLLLNLGRRMGNISWTEGIVNEIHNVEGRGPHWNLGRAILLSLQADRKDRPLLEKAQTHLAAARAARPGWPAAALLAAEFDVLQDNPGKAAVNYLIAVRLGERSPDTVRRTVFYLWSQGRYNEAETLLRDLAQPRNGTLTDSAGGSEVLPRYDEMARGLSEAEREVLATNSVESHLWLAFMAGVYAGRASWENRPEDAVRLTQAMNYSLTQAVDLEESLPPAHACRIMAAGRPPFDAAQFGSRIEDALATIPPSLDRILLLAQCYESAGQFNAAQDAYLALLAEAYSEKGFDRLQEFFVRPGRKLGFDQILAKAINQEIPASSFAQCWARRKSAMVLMSRGKPGDRAEALKMVEANLATRDATSQDKYLRAVLMATSAGKTWRAEAIRMLKEVQDSGSAGPDEQYLLAQLYLLSNQWSEANQQLRLLLTYHGNNPQYVTAFVTELLRKGEVAAADSWLRWLTTVAPEQFITARLRAEAQLLRSKYSAALQTLADYMRRPDAQPTDRLARLDLVASSLQEIAQALRTAKKDDLVKQAVRDSEAMRRELLASQPEQGVALGVLLAEDGRFDAGLAEAVKGWPSTSPDVLADAFQRMTLAAQTDTQRSSLINLVEQALNKHKQPVRMLQVAAGLYTTQRAYPRAEQAFREILAKDGNQVDAMINLSMLLALQGKQLDEAEKLLRRAYELVGPIPSLMDARAMVRLAQNDPRKAISDLKIALEDAISPVYYFHLARAYAAVKDKKAADDALQAARKLGISPQQLHPLEREILAAM